MQKIAVAIVHGVGDTPPDFASGMIADLQKRFSSAAGVPAEGAVEFAPVYWGPILQDPENELWRRMKKGGELDFTTLRRFLVSFAADALAYQPLPGDESVYDSIHAEFARTLKGLAAAAGPTAPLIVIAHSLGTVISSNFFYDLSRPRKDLHGPKTCRVLGEAPSPLEEGKTLTQLHTLGSPIALWSLRFKEFGLPITVPAPALEKIWPQAHKKGRWENFYDPDDVIGYPLKKLNAAYNAAVARDVPVNAGSWLASWNPVSHVGYWDDKDVTKPIAENLAAVWKAVAKG